MSDDAERWIKLYGQSIGRHQALIRTITESIANGGDLKAVVVELIRALDATDALGVDPEADETLYRAWLAAGGERRNYPVVTLVLGDEVSLLRSPEGGQTNE